MFLIKALLIPVSTLLFVSIESAFAADLHMGSTQSMDVLADLCHQINSASPEFVILGGDVTTN